MKNIIIINDQLNKLIYVNILVIFLVYLRFDYNIYIYSFTIIVNIIVLSLVCLS